MNNLKLLIYDFDQLYKILYEIKNEVNIEVSNIDDEGLKIDNLNKENYLIVTKEKINSIKNQFVIENFPIKINKLLEKLNISFLKSKYNEQSQINVGNYIIDLNSREMTFGNLKLKLTEKETDIILFISKSDKATKVSDLQKKVWHYQSDLETHTVETHIYRLRKKILNKFEDDDFIVSEKNGYSIS